MALAPIFRRNLKLPNPTTASNAILAAGIAQNTPAVREVDTGTGLFGGPITSTGTIRITTSGVTTGLIAVSAVTYARMQQESASTLLGNPTTATSTVSEITLGSGLSFSGSQLIVTATGSGTVTRVDTGTGLFGGPITTAGTVSITTSGVTTGLIANSAVTYAKIQNESASTLLGNPTTGSAAPSEIALGTNLSFSGTTLNASGGGSSGALQFITSSTTTGSTTSVTFSSITGSYTDLEIVVRGRGTAAAGVVVVSIQLNGDMGGNYNRELGQAGSGGVIGDESQAGVSFRIGAIAAGTATANYASVCAARIAMYSQTTFDKPIIYLSGYCANTGGGAVNAEFGGGQWSSTASINAIKVFPSAGGFVDGTIISLYGVQ